MTEKKEIESARQEAYEERAAILEFDAGMTRADAERTAKAMVEAMDDVDFWMGADATIATQDGLHEQ